MRVIGQPLTNYMLLNFPFTYMVRLRRSVHGQIWTSQPGQPRRGGWPSVERRKGESGLSRDLERSERVLDSGKVEGSAEPAEDR